MTLVGWWPLTETSGSTAYDYSGNGNHGTTNGSVTRGVAGKAGLTAYEFDGSDDWIDTGGFGNLFDGSNPWTMAGWVQPAATGSQIPIFETRANYNNQLRKLSDDTFEINVYGGTTVTVTSTTTAEADNWYHVTATFNPNGQQKIYVNGTEEGSKSSGSPATKSKSSGIGSNHDQGYRWNGKIADMRVYNRTLTQQEIVRLYRMGSRDVATPAGTKNRTPSSGVAYYPFSSSGVTDQWGSNDGTVNGATYQSSGGPRSDGAYSFNGSSDYITMNGTASAFNHIHQGTPFTIAYWVNHSGSSNAQVIANTNDGTLDSLGFYTSIKSDNTVRFFVSDGSGSYAFGNFSTSGTVPTGSWNHVGITSDNSTLKVYLNGEEDSSSSINLNQSGDATNDNYTGKRSVADKQYLNGSLDDFRFYNRALKPYEIQQLYQYGTKGIDMRRKLVNARK